MWLLADPHAVQISVDGSCFPNEKRRSGYAGIVVYPDDPTEIEIAFQGFKESTINRMELAACIAAMNWVKEEGIRAALRQGADIQRFTIRR
jgi:ribonuclease HI